MNNVLLQYVAESAVCLLLFYLFYALMLRKESCFQFNRFYLLGALAVAVLLPLAHLPAWPSPESVALVEQTVVLGALEEYELAPVEAVPQEEPFDYKPWLLLAYGLGVLFFAVRFGYQLLSLYRYARQEGPYFKLPNQAPVILTNGKLPTFSFLGYVFFDNTQALTPQETERILQHEKVHIDQRHSLDILLVSLVSIVFWFNPLLRLYKNALEQTHEFIADAEVVRHADAREYASLLLKQVFQKAGFALGSYFFFNKSLTLRRINMMKNSPQSPKIRKVLLVMPLLVGLVAALMAMRPAQAPEPFFSDAESGESRSVLSSLKEAASAILPAKDETKAAEYPGGREAADAFVRNNFTFPKVAFDRLTGKEKAVQAVATFQVEINENGKATLAQVLEMEVSPNYPQVQEAIKAEVARVVSAMPAWSPALKDGKPVASKEIIKIASVSADFTSYSKYVEHRQQKTKVTSTSVEVPASGSGAAEFPGGKGPLYHYLNRQFIIPEIVFKNWVKDMEAGGDSTMKFSRFITGDLSINEAGKVTGFKISRIVTTPATTEVTKAVEEEFLRVINRMPAWKPAYENGKPVASVSKIDFSNVTHFRNSHTHGKELAAQAKRVKEPYTPPKNVTTPEGDPIFIAVEKMPEFPGGQKEMFKYLGSSFRLPADAKEAGTKGTLVGSLVVNKEGKITNVEVLKKLLPSVDKEFERVVSEMPTWEPGTQNGKAVAVKYTIPFRIEANDEPKKLDEVAVVGRQSNAEVDGGKVLNNSKNSTPLGTEKTVVGQPAPAADSDAKEKVYIAVQQMPEFLGGQAAMFKYLSTEFTIPPDAAKAGAEGTILASFVVTNEGKVTKATVVKGIMPSLDQEARRVISNMPTWKPGMQNGKPVNVIMNVPYRVVLKEAAKKE